MKSIQKNNNTLQIGDRIPAFSLSDQDRIVWNSRENLLGCLTIVYFYPKDQSDICTKEACAFRDSFVAFTDAGVQVVGINSGSVESHKKFAIKNILPFTLLSDPENKVLKQFGVKKAMFLTGRETFIFNGEGLLIYKFRNFFKGDLHVEKVLAFLGIKE
jgi:peroxiredoxin Q/BCP